MMNRATAIQKIDGMGGLLPSILNTNPGYEIRTKEGMVRGYLDTQRLGTVCALVGVESRKMVHLVRRALTEQPTKGVGDILVEIAESEESPLSYHGLMVSDDLAHKLRTWYQS